MRKAQLRNDPGASRKACSSPSGQGAALETGISFDSYVLEIENQARQKEVMRRDLFSKGGSSSTRRPSSAVAIPVKAYAYDELSPPVAKQQGRVGARQQRMFYTASQGQPAAAVSKSGSRPSSAPSTRLRKGPNKVVRPMSAKPIGGARLRQGVHPTTTRWASPGRATTIPNRPLSSPVYLSTTHPSQRTLGQRIHDAKMDPQSQPWKRNKVC